MKKYILCLIFTLMSTICLSQNSDDNMKTIYLKGNKNELMIESGLILTCVGLIVPPDMIRSASGNWVYKPIYKQPTKIIPVGLGVTFIFSGYIGGLYDHYKSNRSSKRRDLSND